MERQKHMVSLLDGQKVEDAALAVFAAQFGTDISEVKRGGWKVDGPLVIGFDNKADQFMKDRGLNIAVVCTEGVGWVTDEYWRVEIPLRQESENSGWISIGGSSVELSAALLLRCVSDEQVDLAEFIRTFGSRLETNYAIWHSRLVSTVETSEER